MGAAKRRGTFEERKAQAIESGRLKAKKEADEKKNQSEVKRENSAGASMLLSMVAAMGGPMMRGGKRGPFGL